HAETNEHPGRAMAGERPRSEHGPSAQHHPSKNDDHGGNAQVHRWQIGHHRGAQEHEQPARPGLCSPAQHPRLITTAHEEDSRDDETKPGGPFTDRGEQVRPASIRFVERRRYRKVGDGPDEHSHGTDSEDGNYAGSGIEPRRRRRWRNLIHGLSPAKRYTLTGSEG